MSEITDPIIIKTIGKYYELVSRWQKLRFSPEESVFTLLNYPPPTKDVFLDTENKTGFLARNSGMTQMYAGDSVLILDKQTNSGVLSTQDTLSLKSKDLRFSSDNLYINNNRVNPDHLRVPLNAIDTNILIKAATAFESLQNISLLTGIPAPGQIPIPLNSLFDTTSIMVDSSNYSNETRLLDLALERTNKFFPDK